MNELDYLTVCTEGAYLGKSRCNNFDLFRCNNVVYKVNRITGETSPIPESLVEYFIGVKN